MPAKVLTSPTLVHWKRKTIKLLALAVQIGLTEWPLMNKTETIVTVGLSNYDIITFYLNILIKLCCNYVIITFYLNIFI